MQFARQFVDVHLYYMKWKLVINILFLISYIWAIEINAYLTDNDPEQEDSEKEKFTRWAI